jgi:hypothetical protein
VGGILELIRGAPSGDHGVSQGVLGVIMISTNPDHLPIDCVLVLFDEAINFHGVLRKFTPGHLVQHETQPFDQFVSWCETGSRQCTYLDYLPLL